MHDSCDSTRLNSSPKPTRSPRAGNGAARRAARGPARDRWRCSRVPRRTRTAPPAPGVGPVRSAFDGSCILVEISIFSRLISRDIPAREPAAMSDDELEPNTNGMQLTHRVWRYRTRCFIVLRSPRRSQSLSPRGAEITRTGARLRRGRGPAPFRGLNFGIRGRDVRTPRARARAAAASADPTGRAVRATGTRQL